MPKPPPNASISDHVKSFLIKNRKNYTLLENEVIQIPENDHSLQSFQFNYYQFCMNLFWYIAHSRVAKIFLPIMLVSVWSMVSDVIGPEKSMLIARFLFLFKSGATMFLISTFQQRMKWRYSNLEPHQYAERTLSIKQGEFDPNSAKYIYKQETKTYYEYDESQCQQLHTSNTMSFFIIFGMGYLYPNNLLPMVMTSVFGGYSLYNHELCKIYIRNYYSGKTVTDGDFRPPGSTGSWMDHWCICGENGREAMKTLKRNSLNGENSEESSLLENSNSNSISTISKSNAKKDSTTNTITDSSDHDSTPIHYESRPFPSDSTDFMQKIFNPSDSFENGPANGMQKWICEKVGLEIQDEGGDGNGNGKGSKNGKNNNNSPESKNGDGSGKLSGKRAKNQTKKEKLLAKKRD